MSMKNPREVAIKILENAKKALKEKIESLEKSEKMHKSFDDPKHHVAKEMADTLNQHEGTKITPQMILDWHGDSGNANDLHMHHAEIKAKIWHPKTARKEILEYHGLEKSDGKNTAQLNEFKGIPQPPTPKAPEKAIAPTPTIPQPKMPSIGKPSKPLSSFMKSRMEKNKNSDSKNPHEKGVHQAHFGASKKTGTSEVGAHMMPDTKIHPKTASWAKEEHKEKLAELKAMPKPALGKAEEMNKAKIYDIKSKKMIADHGEPEKTTPPKGNLKLVGSAPTKPQPKAPSKKQPKSAK